MTIHELIWLRDKKKRCVQDATERQRIETMKAFNKAYIPRLKDLRRRSYTIKGSDLMAVLTRNGRL